MDIHVRPLPDAPPFITSELNLLSPEEQYERSLLVQDFAGAADDDARERAERALYGFDNRAGV